MIMRKILIGFVMGLAALSAQANVVIGTTRVVFNADKPITTVQLQNTVRNPRVVYTTD